VCLIGVICGQFIPVHLEEYKREGEVVH
jgi:hypothetical protein